MTATNPQTYSEQLEALERRLDEATAIIAALDVSTLDDELEGLVNDFLLERLDDLHTGGVVDTSSVDAPKSLDLISIARVEMWRGQVTDVKIIPGAAAALTDGQTLYAVRKS